MIRRRFSIPISSSYSIACFHRFRHFRGDCCMAAASNFALGQRDFQIMSLRKLSSNASVPSAIGLSSRSFGRNGFRLRGCSSSSSGQNSNALRDNNDSFRLHRRIDTGLREDPACAPCALGVSNEVVRDQLNAGFCPVNGSSASRKGYFRGDSSEKIMVAVDVDEVLGNFVSALNQFIAARYSLKCSVSEYHVYEFFKIWNCSRDEGAQMALQRLSEIYNLCIVTSRQNAIKDHTIEWIEKHYPGLFQEIHFGNHFALDGQSRRKSDMCKSLGAKILIDDNPRYATECAEAGIKVLLFDYENSYPWCKVDTKHPLVTKVYNWEEVEDQLASAAVG
ncbi:uncharacterized protein LOC127265071 isoform X2 [Andrographis paniculata]|uniref:uncharacterized protein LOC127265071 isoform X2 n=1 Tax=Andrographis paniculata TaxID=175694 RepID=UPI0021E7BE5D|nr:uncharacterized protein LOC127265071 isoform X2 [Andrographis paniculata]